MRQFWPVLLLVGLVLTSCKGSLPSEPLSFDAPVNVLSLRWIKKLSPSVPNFLLPERYEANGRFAPVETAVAGFDTDKRRAFIGISTGQFYCLNVINGKTVWRFDLDDAVGSEPLYDPSRKYVFFGADDGKMYALHARSGRLIWSRETGAEIQKKAHLHDGTLYIVNADNTVLALDPEDGEIIWQYRRPSVEGFASSGHASLVLEGSKLLSGFNDGYVVALDLVSGSEIWTSDLVSEVSIDNDAEVILFDVDATPVVADNTVIAASVAGGLRGLDLETGSVQWTNPELTGVTGLVHGSGTVYAMRSGFGMTAVDSSNGSVTWNQKFPTGVLKDPVVYDDVLLVADSEYGLFVLSSMDGHVMQRLNPMQGFFAGPSLHAGFVFILGNGGTLYALSIL